MAWYLAVNTINAIDGLILGHVISSHRSAAAAERACKRAQPTDVRRHGHAFGRSYVPAYVRQAPRRYASGERVRVSDVLPREPINYDE